MRMHRFIHKSLSDTPAGQYTSCRIFYRRLSQQCAEKQALLSRIADEVKSGSESSGDLKQTGQELVLLKQRKASTYECILKLEKEVTPELYNEMLKRFQVAYLSNQKNWTANDKAHFDAILELKQSVVDDAEGWDIVSGSLEGAWIESLVKANLLQGKLEKFAPSGQGTAAEQKAQQATHRQLTREHKKEQARAEELGKKADPAKAERLLPKVLLRRTVMKMILAGMKERRQNRRADRDSE
jgi:hypothetical protein